MSMLTVKIIQARNLIVQDRLTRSSDPYCILRLRGKKQKTKVISENLNPLWDNEVFEFNLKDIGVGDGDALTFTMMDKDKGRSDDPLGSCTLAIEDMKKGETGKLWLKLENVAHGHVLVDVEYKDESGSPVEQRESAAKNTAEFDEMFGDAPDAKKKTGFGSKMKNLVGGGKKEDDDEAWRDTNVGGIGSSEDKALRKMAAEGEKAWKNAGTAPGVKVWHIEKFKVKDWKKKKYGSFYSGDAYIVLSTYKEKDSDKLLHDVHYWLGAGSTIDERGTAAYKTVELDDFLDGVPVQRREVEGFESSLFLGYFPPALRIMDGGVDSGFNHVEPTEYRTRLLQLKGKSEIRLREVELKATSLNHGDCFVLDHGLIIYQFNGRKSSPWERRRAGEVVSAIDSERGGQPEVIVLDDDGSEPKAFWEALRGSAADVAEDSTETDAEAAAQAQPKLFRMSDRTGKMTCTRVSPDAPLKKSMLNSDDVFILDIGCEIFVWVGKGASKAEKREAMMKGERYIVEQGYPSHLPLTRLLETGETDLFLSAFE
eukprot:TRINITY_DN33475_c0_g1_i1.p1 TRINITY_DN33475_c0_g1~~TRINITY_DN33475_c0_g1_i1.p1  ORF type:complete len:540 (+),score=204.99 TRINITY_DN33475_c0_g1_i1:63-1682(+)